METRDYYEVLGVSRNADQAELKQAYRRLAMKYHPDRNLDDRGAENRFKEVQEAYDVLSDSSKRSAYDQFGHAGVNATGGGFHATGFSDIFEDIFGDVFGGGRRSGSRAYRGADLQYELDISLEEAVFGTEKTMDVATQVTCDVCDGHGTAPGTQPEACTTCGGRGQVRTQQGLFTVQQTCPRCRGTGRIITRPCPQCHGNGRTQKFKTLSVKVPAGVDGGDRIRLSGEGEAGVHNGPPGDLYVFIDVQPHKLFKREGSNLYAEIPISFVTAALGGELEVPTLDGRVSLKIPSETQTGRLFRLRGKGIKSVHGGAQGDMICQVIVETPVKLTNKQKEILDEFDKTIHAGGDRHSPQAQSWLDGVKGFFEDLKSWLN